MEMICAMTASLRNASINLLYKGVQHEKGTLYYAAQAATAVHGRHIYFNAGHHLLSPIENNFHDLLRSMEKHLLDSNTGAGS